MMLHRASRTILSSVPRTISPVCQNLIIRQTLQNHSFARWASTKNTSKSDKPDTKKAPGLFKKTAEKLTVLMENKIYRNTSLALVILFYGLAVYSTLKNAPDQDSVPLKKTRDVDPTYDEANIPAPADTTDIYELLAEGYDKKISREEFGTGIKSWRKWMARKMQGDVLEVACGTGRNVPLLYLPQITSITYLDPSKAMLEETATCFEKNFPNFKKVQYVQGKAEELLDLTAKSHQRFDVICETFGICSQQDPVKSLQNMGKILNPGGRIVLVEHGRSNWGFVNKVLDKNAHKRSENFGCRWNLDIGRIVDESGLEIVEEKRGQFGSTWAFVLKNPADPY